MFPNPLPTSLPPTAQSVALTTGIGARMLAAGTKVPSTPVRSQTVTPAATPSAVEEVHDSGDVRSPSPTPTVASSKSVVTGMSLLRKVPRCYIIQHYKTSSGDYNLWLNHFAGKGQKATGGFPTSHSTFPRDVARSLADPSLWVNPGGSGYVHGHGSVDLCQHHAKNPPGKNEPDFSGSHSTEDRKLLKTSDEIISLAATSG